MAARSYDETSTAATTAVDIRIKRNWAEKWVDLVDSSKWLAIFFCEAETIKPAIPNKEESRGLKGFWKEFVWFISSVIRGMAQLTWNDNIWTGLGILSGACVGNWCVGICAFIGCCYTTGFPLLFGPPELKPLVGSGIYGLNGTLLGMAMGCFDARASQARTFDEVMLSCCRLFLPLSFMAVFCAVVTQWLNTKWTAKTGIPACSWPYNISMWTWIACATLTTNFQTIYTANPPSAPQYGQITVEWFFRSWMTGISQMMFSLNMWSGFCLLVGAFIGSPSTCFLTIWGSLIGVVTGVLLGMPFNSIIGLGVIGFNPIIYATGMGGQFVAPSLVGFIWMTFGCVMCGILAQLATNLAVLPWGGGSYSVPFTLMTTFMFGLFQEDLVARVPLMPARLWKNVERVWAAKSRASQASSILLKILTVGHKREATPKKRLSSSQQHDTNTVASSESTAAPPSSPSQESLMLKEVSTTTIQSNSSSVRTTTSTGNVTASQQHQQQQQQQDRTLRRRSSVAAHMAEEGRLAELRAIDPTQAPISESDIVELMIAAGDMGSQAGLTAQDGPESGWRKALIETALRTHGSRFAKVMDERLPAASESLRQAAKEIAATTSACKKVDLKRLMDTTFNPYASSASSATPTTQQQQASPLQHPLVDPLPSSNTTAAAVAAPPPPSAGRPSGLAAAAAGGSVDDFLGVLGYDQSQTPAGRGVSDQAAQGGIGFPTASSTAAYDGGGAEGGGSPETEQQMVLQQLLLLDQLQRQQQQQNGGTPGANDRQMAGFGSESGNLAGLLGSSATAGHLGEDGRAADSGAGAPGVGANEDQLQLGLLLQQQREAAAAAAAGDAAATATAPATAAGAPGGFPVASAGGQENSRGGVVRGGTPTGGGQTNEVIQQLQQQLTFAMALQLLQQQGGVEGGQPPGSRAQQPQQQAAGGGSMSPSFLTNLSQHLEGSPMEGLDSALGKTQQSSNDGNSALAAAAAMLQGGAAADLSAAPQHPQQQQQLPLEFSPQRQARQAEASGGYSAMSVHQQQVLRQHVVDKFDMSSDRWTQATGKQLELIIRALYQCNPQMREKGDLAAAIWHAVGMLCLHRASAAAATAGSPSSSPIRGGSPRGVPRSRGSPTAAAASATSPAAELRNLLLTSKEWQVAAGVVFSIAHVINSLYADKCGRVDQKSLLMALTLATSPNSLTESELVGISRLQQSILANLPAKALTDEVAPSLVDPYIRNLKPLIDLSHPSLLDATRLPIFERSALRYALQGYSSRLCLFADAHLLALTSIALASTEFGINVTQLSHPYRPNVPWYQLVGGDSPAAQRARRNGSSTESDLHVAVQLLLKYCRTTAASAARRAATAEAVVGSPRRLSPAMAAAVAGGLLSKRIDFDSHQPLGVSILGDRVVDVDPGRQAACIGVRRGWRLVKVNEHAFSGEILRDVIALRGRCTIEFEMPADELAVVGSGGIPTDSGSTTVTAGSGTSSDRMNFGTAMAVVGKRKPTAARQQSRGKAESPSKRRRAGSGTAKKATTAAGKGKKVAIPSGEAALAAAAAAEVAAAAMAAVGLMKEPAGATEEASGGGVASGEASAQAAAPAQASEEPREQQQPLPASSVPLVDNVDVDAPLPEGPPKEEAVPPPVDAPLELNQTVPTDTTSPPRTDEMGPLEDSKGDAESEIAAVAAAAAAAAVGEAGGPMTGETDKTEN
ncbi:hypothetical protein FOZ61_009062 [Perkinsus olseni]|uniref:PDZ domain-containing protein n=1 Tax=Perkinsus olseni TaxID=32597 RepID=A0A7J6L376_PEROL|nr:hypothetical protein FOZ61_009062 [Perkinsus olseni]